MQEYLTIMDFCTGETHIYPVHYNQDPCMEELLESLGHNANDCQWMFSSNNVIFHSEILGDDE